MTLTFSILYSFLNNTYFSSGNNTATCTSPAAMAARVLASAAKVVADNLAVIHPYSHVEKRISAARISRYAASPLRLPLPRNVVFMFMK